MAHELLELVGPGYPVAPSPWGGGHADECSPGGVTIHLAVHDHAVVAIDVVVIVDVVIVDVEAVGDGDEAVRSAERPLRERSSLRPAPDPSSRPRP
jgi:hypothetical protein